jgi:hypothetical protein
MYFVLALGGVLAERCFAAGHAPQLSDLILDVVVAHLPAHRHVGVGEAIPEGVDLASLLAD